MIVCFDFVIYFLDGFFVLFLNLRNFGVFFNIENIKFEVYLLVCYDGSVCIENVQFYFLFCMNI